jgi:hypothetical protein
MTLRSFRSLYLCRPVIVILLSLVGFTICAQTKSLYSYLDLSHAVYEKKRDSLKKSWQCPSLYKEKATQKLYKEIWDGRTSFLTSAIDDNSFIHENEIYNYVDAIISDLTRHNKNLVETKPILLIDRSSAANAYAIGGNVVAVNLGLLTFVQTKEELALVIAHELSHNILKHAENSMKERAEWFTSDEYKRSVNAVLDSKFERVTRLKKVFEGYTFDHSKHQRYHESDADSLAIVLLKNANISFNPAVYLRLDSCDMQYHQPLQKPVKSAFASFNMTTEDWWYQKKSKGLSTRNYDFKNDSKIEDSLKTHPDCTERYTRTLPFASAQIKQTPLPATLKAKANRMIIWNLFASRNLTACMYRILLEKDKGDNDEWYDFMIANIFYGLSYSDKELERFNAIRVKPKEYISADYYQLQNMFEQVPSETLAAFCKTLDSQNFWQKLSADARGFKNLFQSITSNDKGRSVAAKEFLTAFPFSMYCEFADQFKK